jgi:hypothetical protein
VDSLVKSSGGEHGEEFRGRALGPDSGLNPCTAVTRILWTT